MTCTVLNRADTRGPKAKRLQEQIHLAHVVKADFIVRRDGEYRRTEFARQRRGRIEGHEIALVARLRLPRPAAGTRRWEGWPRP